jgi:hypothetical protein
MPNNFSKKILRKTLFDIFYAFFRQKNLLFSIKKGMSRDVPTSQMQLVVIISTKIQGGAL